MRMFARVLSVRSGGRRKGTARRRIKDLFRFGMSSNRQLESKDFQAKWIEIGKEVPPARWENWRDLLLGDPGRVTQSHKKLPGPSNSAMPQVAHFGHPWMVVVVCFLSNYFFRMFLFPCKGQVAAGRKLERLQISCLEGVLGYAPSWNCFFSL